jgi:hypothetical protein
MEDSSLNDMLKDPIFKQMTESFSSQEVQGCIQTVNSIAGYKLSDVDRAPFLYFHKYITDPQPEFITSWRDDAKLEKWYHRFVNGFLMDVQNAMACVCYHHERLCTIESTILSEIEKHNYKSALGNSTVALGNTLVWDFEYQAFILAFRRCLDYLARAICNYFKNDFHSFRRLGDFLQKLNRDEITTPLIEIHKKYKEAFEFVLSEGDRKSLRDKISHYEYVPVGTINLSSRGFMLAGGGENLGFREGGKSVLLSEAINSHLLNIKSCTNEMIHTLVDQLKSVGV